MPPWADLPSGQDPGGGSGARGASGGTGAEGPSGDAAGPRLPLWLKGHPYHNLKGELDYLVDSYERGELTEAEAAAQTEDNQGSAVSVIVELINDPANTDAVIAWLKSKGVSAEYVAKHEAPHPHYVGAYVPVSMMGALSRQPGVIRITPPRPPNLPSEKDSGSRPAPQSDVQAQASMPTPTPLPTAVSQGVAAHRAPAWRTALPRKHRPVQHLSEAATGLPQLPPSRSPLPNSRQNLRLQLLICRAQSQIKKKVPTPRQSTIRR